MTLHPLDWVSIAVYFGLVMGVGLWFSRFARTTRDFFFAGQRFSWWLVGVSCVATLVGSYSFINYSEVGFNFGICSLTNYTNDWFVMPIFLLGWLPIIYYSRVQSIPEYFQRRFDFKTRMLVLVLLLVYLEGYVGINLLTIGIALKGLFGWNVMISAAFMALVSAVYLYRGGQTSVIMTDLFQGILLLGVGLLIFLLGLSQLGGFGGFWEALPLKHRLPFADFNEPPTFHFVGEFWGDAMAGTFAFYLINQGVLMRFLSAKSVHEGRKAMIFVAMALMPLAALAVGNAGWIGRAMVTAGLLPADTQASDVFVTVARTVCMPGVFGVVIAAMIAALMSTLDTLITAVSAIAVNDIWKTAKPNRPDAHYVRTARVAAVLSTVVGIAMVPLFQQFESIYQAMSHFTAIVTPPLCIAIFLGITWPRFSSNAVFGTLILSSVAMALSMLWPHIITPLAHGVSPEEGFSYMRSLYGLLVSLGIALVLGILLPSKQRPAKGLTLGSLREAETAYLGANPPDQPARSTATFRIEVDDSLEESVRLPVEMMQELGIRAGELVYIVDSRRWLGGFRALHAKAASPSDTANSVQLSSHSIRRGNLDPKRMVRVERLV